MSSSYSDLQLIFNKGLVYILFSVANLCCTGELADIFFFLSCDEGIGDLASRANCPIVARRVLWYSHDAPGIDR